MNDTEVLATLKELADRNDNLALALVPNSRYSPETDSSRDCWDVIDASVLSYAAYEDSVIGIGTTPENAVIAATHRLNPSPTSSAAAWIDFIDSEKSLKDREKITEAFARVIEAISNSDLAVTCDLVIEPEPRPATK